MVKIFQYQDHYALREKASSVKKEEIGSKKLAKIISDMKKALASQDDGVAIAAPQIGVTLRIFVVSGKAFAINNSEEEKYSAYKDMVFINPKIEKSSRKKEIMDEGCLSVRGKYGKVERPEKTTITALDENGKKFKYGGSGLLSQIFQHETDHLDGILFIDKATDIENI